MNKFCGLAAMLAVSAAPLQAVWENATRVVQGTHVTVDTSRTRSSLLDLTPEKAVTMTLKKKTSLRWKITAEKDGEFSVFKDKVKFRSKSFHAGANTIKMFLEPGAYSFVSSAKGLARCEIWKERRLTSIVPEGGGYPVELPVGGKTYTYYAAGADTLPVLKVKGPARVYIYFRSILPENAKQIKADIYVRENDSVVAHTVAAMHKSKKASADGPAAMISKAIVVSFKAPAGIRRYRIDIGQNKGFVKFYTAYKKKMVKAGTVEQGTIEQGMKTAPPEKPKTERYARSPEGAKQTKKANTARLRLDVALGGGAEYNDNVYRYSGEFIDTFGLGLKEYRYPEVKSTDDFVIPLRFGTRAQFHGFTADLNGSADLYGNNHRMNRRAFSCALGWKGPVTLRARYRLTPYSPVRPTYYAPNAYRMLSYLSHEAALRAGFRLPGRPWLEASLKRYDYNTTFEGYDALSARIGAGVTIKKKIVYELQAAGGKLFTDTRVRDADWSNWQGSIKLAAELPYGAWTFGAGGSLAGQTYTTSDSEDSHYRRNDFLATASPAISYTWRTLTVTSSVAYAYRNADSPFETIEKHKDYGAITGGVTFDWKIKLI